MSGHAAPTRRILVADADPDARALYRRALAHEGCDVVEAVDGRDALITALVREPGLIIIELDLTAIDGVALCEILRADRTTANVPILVVTKETRSEEIQRALQAGATSVLMKTAPLDSLIDEAHRLLTHESREAAPALSQDVHTKPEKAELGAAVSQPPPAPRRAS